jgi:GNAT superfamily N-acetyltransferase
VLIQTSCPSVVAEAVLYEDRVTTSINIPGARVRPVTPGDAAEIAARRLDGGAKWLLQLDGEIAGAGGILYHYNRPYGDVFMEVAEPFRRRGLGAFLVQELKRVCYEGGSVPAARCNVNNAASRPTLQKAGFSPCGNIVTGTISEAVGN